MNNTVIRILFAGAPHSGKSSVLQALRSRVTAGCAAEFIPECATAFLNVNMAFCENQEHFQNCVTALQIMLEGAAERRLHTKAERTKLLIADRGFPDIYVYNDNVDIHYAMLHVDAPEAVFEKYDLIVYFESFGGGAYLDNNAVRVEEGVAQQAVRDRTDAVYGNTYGVPKLSVPVMETVEERVEFVEERLNAWLGERVFA